MSGHNGPPASDSITIRPRYSSIRIGLGSSSATAGIQLASRYTNISRERLLPCCAASSGTCFTITERLPGAVHRKSLCELEVESNLREGLARSEGFSHPQATSTSKGEGGLLESSL